MAKNVSPKDRERLECDQSLDEEIASGLFVDQLFKVSLRSLSFHKAELPHLVYCLALCSQSDCLVRANCDDYSKTRLLTNSVIINSGITNSGITYTIFQS